MKDAIKLLRTYLPPYKKFIGLNILFNLLGTLFGLFSFALVIPLLETLFNTDGKVYQMRDIDISLFPPKIPRADLINNMYAFVQHQSETLGSLKILIYIGAFFILMVLFKTMFNYLGSLTMVFIRNFVVRDIRNKLYSKIVELPIGYFTEERKGDVIARITGDVSEVEHSIMTSLDMFFKNPIIIFLTVSMMVLMSWQLTLFVFVLFPVAGSMIGIIGKRLRKSSLVAQTKMGEILSTIEETLGGLRIVKAFNAEKRMHNVQQDQNEAYRGTMNKVMGRHQLASPLSEFLGTVVIVSVIWYGGSLILNKEATMLRPSMFIAYVVFFYSIIQPTKAFSSAFYNIQKGLASMDRINRVLDTENRIKSKTDAKKIKVFENNIDYRDIWFRYGEEYVLKNIAVKINKGETVALVGQSGSGKSTMVDLLPRFYDVEKGGIFIDGTDIRDAELNSLRHLFGIVNQEPILFNDTIHNNIAFGMENVGEEEIIKAAKIANAHEFITQTENGYHTNIGDRGSKLSGGQRQRISIARAILKNPPILILDEATSALDTESERLVQDAIYNLMKDRTSIVIAHRLSTIRNVDRIYVLQDGEIIESGNYDELLALNGAFKKLHDNQFN